MRAGQKILNNLKEGTKDEFYYKANDVEQELFKLRDLAEDEDIVKRIEALILELNNIRMDGYNNLKEAAGDKKYEVSVYGYNTNEDGDNTETREKSYYVYAQSEKEAEKKLKDKIDSDFKEISTYYINGTKEMPIDEYNEEDVLKALEVIKNYANSHYRQNGFYTKKTAEEIEEKVKDFILPRGDE